MIRSSADEQSTANMTNLAIKGLMGIQAMAEISTALDESSDAQQYGVWHIIISCGATRSHSRAAGLRLGEHQCMAITSTVYRSDSFPFQLRGGILVCSDVQSVF